jgi:hypothetical protein
MPGLNKIQTPPSRFKVFSTTKASSMLPTTVGRTAFDPFWPIKLILAPILWLIDNAQDIGKTLPVPVFPARGDAPPSDGFWLGVKNLPPEADSWIGAWQSGNNKWITTTMAPDQFAEFRGIKGVAETGELFIDAYKTPTQVEAGGVSYGERITDGQTRGQYTIEPGGTWVYVF